MLREKWNRKQLQFQWFVLKMDAKIGFGAVLKSQDPKRIARATFNLLAPLYAE